MRGRWRPTARHLKLTETDVLVACLKALHHNRRVAWSVRMNVGAAKMPSKTKPGGEQLVKFAFPGCSDIIGQMDFARGGRFLAIEVKRDWTLWPTPEEFEKLYAKVRKTKDDRRLIAQRAFLMKVREAGGYCGVACGIDDLGPILGGVKVTL